MPIWEQNMLNVENLNVRYGGVHALKGISFSVPEGKVIALLGANGAGKSTTLRSICGLVKPDDGRILFKGQDIAKLKTYDRVKAGIAMVPEGRRIFTNLSVHENLLMGATIRNDEANVRADMQRLFTLFPVLKARLSQKGGTLSGGEQQMLAVARALMSKPKLLLMDEPSIGLAPNLVDQLYERIDRIHDEGLTILLVEQNATAALSIADYGYVMETGQLVMEGSADYLNANDDIKKAYIGE
jgi:branched-chain amino acid transport system ATP-binding protein